MRTKLGIVWAALALVAVGGGLEARGGIYGEADVSGDCSRTVVFSGASPTRWAIACAVTALDAGCCNPIVTPLGDTRLVIRYDTPNGCRVRTIDIGRPNGIGDDIDPFRGVKADSGTMPFGGASEDDIN